jgi:DNA-binding response OmpR family regulator
MTTGKTILLVDDEAGLRRVLGIVLRRAGFEVLEAADGDEAMGWQQATSGPSACWPPTCACRG